MKNFDFISAALLFGMLAVALLILREWDEFQAEQLVLQANNSVSQQIPSIDEIPSAPTNLPSEIPAPAAGITTEQSASLQSTVPNTNLIVISNDVLELSINPTGGDIVEVKLLDHLQSLDGEPIVLLTENFNHTYVAQSGLVGANGTDTSSARPTFTAYVSELQLREGQDTVVLDLHHQQGDVEIIKRYRLNRGDYYVGVEYLINNNSSQSWSAAFYAQIKRDGFIPPSTGGMGMKPFVGAAITTPEDRYLKFDFGDLEDENFSQTVDTGWAAMLQHYFLSAWIPDPALPLEYNLRQSSSNGFYYVGFTQAPMQVNAGSQGNVSAGFYVGPKDQYRLRDLSENLELTVDYGWIWWAAQPIYAVLYFLHEGQIKSFGMDSQIFDGFSNWGICIILLTLIVKLLFFKLSEASYKSMARMRKLQPKLAALKERYGDDKQQFSQEMMRLYQKEKINPLGGCLPILVQMPVFIALYWVLKESVEIRHEPFFGWILDLSAKDPWFILPIIMGASMWLQMRLNPAPPDPTQAKVMQMMPFIFTFMFMWFPAGLVLYWVSNNILSISQQWYITRSIERADTKEA